MQSSCRADCTSLLPRAHPQGCCAGAGAGTAAGFGGGSGYVVSISSIRSFSSGISGSFSPSFTVFCQIGPSSPPPGFTMKTRSKSFGGPASPLTPTVALSPVVVCEASAGSTRLRALRMIRPPADSSQSRSRSQSAPSAPQTPGPHHGDLTPACSGPSPESRSAHR